MYKPNQSPEPGFLHHPQPQHIIPQVAMRSPPPGQGQAVGGQPYQAVGEGPMHPSYGNFFNMNDTTAQMGIQVGRSAVMAGQQYLDQSMSRFVSTQTLRHYFNVSNSYVMSKIWLVLFPWRHKPWSRQVRRSEVSGQNEGYRAPRDDINSPDMYIPVMSIVTYILLSSVLAGLRGDFSPELLGVVGTKAFFVILLEFCFLKLGTYLLSISSESQFLDLFAYSGYKFIGIILALLAEGFGSFAHWFTFLYCFAANSFFLMRSLKYVVLPESSGSSATAATVTSRQRSRRIQFLFVYSFIVQLVFMFGLQY